MNSLAGAELREVLQRSSRWIRLGSLVRAYGKLCFPFSRMGGSGWLSQGLGNHVR